MDLALRGNPGNQCLFCKQIKLITRPADTRPAEVPLGVASVWKTVVIDVATHHHAHILVSVADAKWALIGAVIIGVAWMFPDLKRLIFFSSYQRGDQEQNCCSPEVHPVYDGEIE